LQEIDPKRFRRAERVIRCVFLKPQKTSLASYAHLARICFIDWDRIPADVDSQGRVAMICVMIVHEATHGVIEGKRFPYSRSNRSRIEAVCVAEQRRMMKKLEQQRSVLVRLTNAFGFGRNS